MAKAKTVKPKNRSGRKNPETMLTDQQEAFCRLYLTDARFNATEAARLAGYSARTAKQQGSRLLTYVDVQAYLSTLRAAALEKFEITNEKIIEEVAALAFGNIMDFVTVCPETGQAWIDLSKCSREQARALAGFEVIELPPLKSVIEGEEVTREVLKIKIKMWDKLKALEQLMKHRGLLASDVVNNNTINLGASIEEEDKTEIARRVAFMLRSAAQEKPKAPKAPKTPPLPK